MNTATPLGARVRSVISPAYVGMSNPAVMDLVQAGGCHLKPRKCPANVYAVLLTCWEEDPTQRPSFAYLEAAFTLLQHGSTPLPPGEAISTVSLSVRRLSSELHSPMQLLPCPSHSPMVSLLNATRDEPIVQSLGATATGGQYGRACHDQLSASAGAYGTVATVASSNTPSHHYGTPERSAAAGEYGTVATVGSSNTPSHHYATPDAHSTVATVGSSNTPSHHYVAPERRAAAGEYGTVMENYFIS